ncbi:MAG TPA: hypothetical protein VH040_18325 [Usitatibacter sp.]|jgi:hypothetical protein|nr:hypothetical protein [Usitatibacter sp.]
MMKQTLGVIAILLLALASGCAATQGGGGNTTMAQSLGTGKKTDLQCMPGWSACVCDKTEKCCSPRLDCSCDGGGHPSCT